MTPGFKPGFTITKDLVAVAVGFGPLEGLGVSVGFSAIPEEGAEGGAISANELGSPWIVA